MPDEPRQTALVAEALGYFVLERDHREIGRLRNQTVVSADEVDREVAVSEASMHHRLDLARDQRQRLPGKDLVAPGDELSAEEVSLWREIRGRRREVDPLASLLGLGGPGRAQVSEHTRDIQREVVDPLVKTLTGRFAEDLIEVLDASGDRILFEELVGDELRIERLELPGNLHGIDGRLDDIENARSISDTKVSGALGALPEGLDEATARLRARERRGEDRDDGLGPRHKLHDAQHNFGFPRVVPKRANPLSVFLRTGS